MRRQIYVAIVFPLLLLTLMSTERVATVFLGHYPSSAFFWAASIELRSLFRITIGWLEMATEGRLVLQAVLLVAFAIAVCGIARTRHGMAFSFVVNHAAFLAVGAATMLANGASFASVDPMAPAPFNLIPFHGIHAGWLHGIVFAVGLMGCFSCHYAYLAKARGRERAVKARLTELSLGFAGRR